MGADTLWPICGTDVSAQAVTDHWGTIPVTGKESDGPSCVYVLTAHCRELRASTPHCWDLLRVALLSTSLPPVTMGSVRAGSLWAFFGTKVSVLAGVAHRGFTCHHDEG